MNKNEEFDVPFVIRFRPSGKAGEQPGGGMLGRVVSKLSSATDVGGVGDGLAWGGGGAVSSPIVFS